jgi:Immunity protein 52
MSKVPNNCFAGVYWGGRRESSRVCAERICNFLRNLGEIDALSSRWFITGSSRKEALSENVSADILLVQEILERGRNLDLPRPLQQSLGFTLSLWNGAQSENRALSILFRCGAFANNVGNSVVLSLPMDCQGLRFELARTLITILVRSFSPDWGVVSSRSIAQFSTAVHPGMPRAGWLTYLRHHTGQAPVSHAFESQVINSAGVLLITTKEAFHSADEGHIASVAAVADWIARAAGQQA